jgi:NTP pyrophosphatase (non-canonical NTP hydrolase)
MTRSILDKSTEFSRDFEVNPKLEEGISTAQLLAKTIEFLQEELRETQEAIAENDQPEIIDGFGDVAFIALNGIYKAFRFQGDNHDTAHQKAEEVMHRICNANLGKKQTDGTIRYKNGKVQKPEGWQPPAYDDIIAA